MPFCVRDTRTLKLVARSNAPRIHNSTSAPWQTRVSTAHHPTAIAVFGQYAFQHPMMLCATCRAQSFRALPPHSASLFRCFASRGAANRKQSFITATAEVHDVRNFPVCWCWRNECDKLFTVIIPTINDPIKPGRLVTANPSIPE